MLIDELWDSAPPRSAPVTAQTYVYQIRRRLDEAERGLGRRVLRTSPPGYAFSVPEEAFDHFRFRQLTRQARRDIDAGRLEAASGLLTQALGLWTGEPLCNVAKGPVLTGFAASLGEERTGALNLRAEADLLAGKFHQLIPEMQGLIAENPYQEWYHQVLMFSLAVLGRRHEALNAYSRVRRQLAEELGLAPCADLRALQDAVLGDRPLPVPALAGSQKPAPPSGRRLSVVGSVSA